MATTNAHTLDAQVIAAGVGIGAVLGPHRRWNPGGVAVDEDNAIAEIDLDLEAAVVHRRVMFRKFLARDDKANRAAFDAATDHLNELLDLRNEMVAAERVVAR